MDAKWGFGGKYYVIKYIEDNVFKYRRHAISLSPKKPLVFGTENLYDRPGSLDVRRHTFDLTSVVKSPFNRQGLSPADKLWLPHYGGSQRMKSGIRTFNHFIYRTLHKENNGDNF